METQKYPAARNLTALVAGIVIFLGVTAVPPWSQASSQAAHDGPRAASAALPDTDTEDPLLAASGAVRTGVASFMDPKYGSGYLALPEGRGHRVTICGPVACVTRTSNDAGPDKAMQRAGRVADLSFRDFGIVCGCDPWQKGLVRVTVTYHGKSSAPRLMLPNTDTEG